MRPNSNPRRLPIRNIHKGVKLQTKSQSYPPTVVLNGESLEWPRCFDFGDIYTLIWEKKVLNILMLTRVVNIVNNWTREQPIRARVLAPWTFFKDAFVFFNIVDEQCLKCLYFISLTRRRVCNDDSWHQLFCNLFRVIYLEILWGNFSWISSMKL